MKERAQIKYRIEKHTENKWWDWAYPPPGWWLIRNGRRGRTALVCKTWQAAMNAMWRDIREGEASPREARQRA